MEESCYVVCMQNGEYADAHSHVRAAQQQHDVDDADDDDGRRAERTSEQTIE